MAHKSTASSQCSPSRLNLAMPAGTFKPLAASPLCDRRLRAQVLWSTLPQVQTVFLASCGQDDERDL